MIFILIYLIINQSLININLQGMAAFTLTAWIPQLHPPPCTKQQQSLVGHQCRQASRSQLGFLILALGFLSFGSGGIRPCSIPFGVDQFDPTTDEGRKGINSFFNWYYTSFTVVLLITQTLVVYIQDSVSWVLGFGIPTILMFCSIILFFIGTNIYVHIKPEGSIFSSIAQVFVAAYKKRKLKFPEEVELNGVLYDPPLKGTAVFTKLPLTKEFKYFTKAAIILENELNPEGTPINKWRLCSIQQVEEVKRIVRIIPIWASGIISLVAMTQQGTFIVSQALKMDRHLGPNFQIPAGSVSVISFLTVGLWLPFYDRVMVPALRKITKHEAGITLLQRIGIGIVFSVLSMVVAAFIERERRSASNSHNGLAPMSVFWLAPQLILLGFCEAFNIIGQIEFFNRQFPEHMMSMGNALFACSFALANYVSSLMVTIIHHVTGTNGRPDWLANNIDAGRLDYFFYLVAGIGVLNFGYFLYVAHRYVYKGSVKHDDEKPAYVDVELSSRKA